MSRYRYRQYEPGDEIAINELYFSVTGRRRSVKQFMWQWQDAPGGKGDIWLIEEIRGDGSAKLIGHHGIMPHVFSYGGNDLLAGKTENTMVLPEYRHRILYPKFESIFLSEYEKKFDLLFSTTGPPAAIRQRLMQGYQAKKKWICYEWALGPGAIYSRVAFSLAARQHKKAFKVMATLCRNLGKTWNKIAQSIRSMDDISHIQILNSDEARSHHFFSNFWNKARHAYGLTPRRHRNDLQWRFWDNPYGIHTSFIYQDNGGSGYAIVRDLGNEVFRLEDIAIYPIDSTLLSIILDSVSVWVFRQGGNILFFNTVDDNNGLTSMFHEYTKKNMYHRKPFSFAKRHETYMPRRISKHCLIINHKNELNWYITPFVFEGR